MSAQLALSITRALKSKPTRQVTPAGLVFVQHAEGAPGTGAPVLTAYQDSKGVWTIGWGHTLHVVKGMVATFAQCVQWLDDDLDDAESAVCRFVTVPINDNQFDALASMVFNIGVEAFRTSTLLRRLNAGDYAAIPALMAQWNKITWIDGNGRKQSRVVNGLVNRRAAEGALFTKPSAQPAPPAIPLPTRESKPLPLIKIPQATFETPVLDIQPIEPPAQIMAGETPDAPPQTVAQQPGGKSGIAALLAGAGGIVAEGYNQAQPVIQAVQNVFYGIGSYGNTVKIIGALLAVISIGTLAFSLWKKHRQVKGAA